MPEHTRGRTSPTLPTPSLPAPTHAATPLASAPLTRGDRGALGSQLELLERPSDRTLPPSLLAMGSLACTHWAACSTQHVAVQHGHHLVAQAAVRRGTMHARPGARFPQGSWRLPQASTRPLSWQPACVTVKMCWLLEWQQARKQAAVSHDALPPLNKLWCAVLRMCSPHPPTPTPTPCLLVHTPSLLGTHGAQRATHP
jgi:hypothetical protein